MALSARSSLFKAFGRTRRGISAYRPRGLGGLANKASTFARRAAALEDAQWDAAYDEGQVSLDGYIEHLNSRLKRSWLTQKQSFTIKRKVNTVQREFADEKFEATLAQQLNAGKITPTQAASANLQRHKATLGVLDPNSKRYLTQLERVNELQIGFDRSRRQDIVREINNQLANVRFDRPSELLEIVNKYRFLKEDAQRTGDVNEALVYDTREQEALLNYQRALVTNAGRDGGGGITTGGVTGGGTGGGQPAPPSGPQFQSVYGLDIPNLQESVLSSGQVQRAQKRLDRAMRSAGGSGDRAARAGQQLALAQQFNLPPDEIQGFQVAYQNALATSEGGSQRVQDAQDNLDKVLESVEFTTALNFLEADNRNWDNLLRSGQVSKKDYFDNKRSVSSDALQLYQKRTQSQFLDDTQLSNLNSSVRSWQNDFDSFDIASRSPDDYEIFQVEKNTETKLRGDLETREIGPGGIQQVKREYAKIGDAWHKLRFEGDIGGDFGEFVKRAARAGLQGTDVRAFIDVFNSDGKRVPVPIVYQKVKDQVTLTPTPTQAVLDQGKVWRLVRQPIEGGGWKWAYVKTPDDVEKLLERMRKGESVNLNSAEGAKARSLFGDQPSDLQGIVNMDVFQRSEGGVYNPINISQFAATGETIGQGKAPTDFPIAQVGVAKDVGKFITDPSFRQKVVGKVPFGKSEIGKAVAGKPSVFDVTQPFIPGPRKGFVERAAPVVGEAFKGAVRNVPKIIKQAPQKATQALFGPKEGLIQKVIRQKVAKPVARLVQKVKLPKIFQPKPKRVVVKAKPAKKIAPVKTQSAASAAKVLRSGFINKTISLSSAYKKYGKILTPKHIRSIFKSVPVKFG